MGRGKGNTVGGSRGTRDLAATGCWETSSQPTELFGQVVVRKDVT